MSSTPSLATLGLPPLVQIGFVVRDLKESMAKYERLYGPWQRFDGSVPAATYRGRSADAQLDIAIGHSGSPPWTPASAPSAPEATTTAYATPFVNPWSV